MQRSAAEVMQAIIFAAVAEALDALRRASRGVPNTLLRDVQSVHRNTTFDDLPKELQDSIVASARTAFSQLLKEGYSVAPREAAPPVRRPPPRQDGPPRRGPGGADDRPRGPRSDRAPANRSRGVRGPGSGPGGGPRSPGARPRKPKGKPKLS